MITWINLLHIYQPPYQHKETLKHISQRSYERILDVLEKNPNAKITLNIQGCLTEQLIENGLSNIVNRIKSLAGKKQIELVGSAKFHPILPLIPESEAIRQIELNNKINKEAFGDDIYNPQGFFLPEMAYSPEAAKIIHDLNFKWIILDEISSSLVKSEKLTRPNDCPPERMPIRAGSVEREVKSSSRYFIKDIGLEVVFRDRGISKNFPPNVVLKKASDGDDQAIITATDGELYGHYHQNLNCFEDALKSDLIKTLTVSEYLDSLSGEEDNIEWVEPIASSWESEQEELEKNIPFSLWDNPENLIHQKLWNIAKIAIELVQNNQSDPGHHWAQSHLDHGLASCTFWWASGKKFHDLSPESWSPEQINRGLNKFLYSVRALENIDKKIKIEAEHLAAELKKDIWVTHWNRISS